MLNQIVIWKIHFLDPRRENIVSVLFNQTFLTAAIEFRNQAY